MTQAQTASTEVTMGAKKRKQNTVNVANAVNVATKTKGETTLKTNTSAVEVAGTEELMVNEVAPVATKRQLKVQEVQPAWYLQDSEGLEGVTSESSNSSIGLKEIKVFPASQKQNENKVLAIVTIETIVAQIKGIQVIESTRDNDNSIYLRMQSRSYEDANKGTQYINDVALDRKMTAQILRHVETMLEDK